MLIPNAQVKQKRATKVLVSRRSSGVISHTGSTRRKPFQSDHQIKLQKPVNFNQMKQPTTRTLNKNVLKNLGVLNKDYVVFEQLGPDGKIHRNFVTKDVRSRSKRNIRFATNTK